MCSISVPCLFLAYHGPQLREPVTLKLRRGDKIIFEAHTSSAYDGAQHS